MKVYLIGLILFCVGLFHAAAGVSADFKAAVEFKAPTNMGMTVSGKATAQGKASLDGDEGEASLELKNLDTGMSLRNRHMLEDLHAAEFPLATMKWKGSKGTLTLNGVAKEVTLKVSGKKYEFDVMLPEFGLKGRRYLGNGVQDKVSVSVEIQ